MICYLKFRERGKRKFYFMRSDGGGTTLRIHAARLTREQAEKECANVAATQPDLETKIVEVTP